MLYVTLNMRLGSIVFVYIFGKEKCTFEKCLACTEMTVILFSIACATCEDKSLGVVPQVASQLHPVSFCWRSSIGASLKA